MSGICHFLPFGNTFKYNLDYKKEEVVIAV